MSEQIIELYFLLNEAEKSLQWSILPEIYPLLERQLSALSLAIYPGFKNDKAREKLKTSI